MNTLAVRKYATPRNSSLSHEQAETRRYAYAIKSTASPCADFDTAAREMAAHISGPCWLGPIPNSTGNTDANAQLARTVAMYCPGAEVVKAIFRTQPAQSQCIGHTQALGSVPADQHHFASTNKVPTPLPTYFVDNLTTSSHTLEAARTAHSSTDSEKGVAAR